MDDNNYITAICSIICSCGEKHILLPGLDAPIYWCHNEIKCLTEGDGVEYEENADITS